jgi:hypothetical protein
MLHGLSTCSQSLPLLTCCFGCFFLLPPLQKQRSDPEQLAAAAAVDKQQKKKQKDRLGGSLALQVEQHTAQVSGIMSAATFSSLELSEQTAKGIADMNFVHMTEVQVRVFTGTYFTP